MSKVRVVFEIVVDDVNDEITQDSVVAGMGWATGWGFPDSEGNGVYVDLESAKLVEFEKL